MSIEYGLRKLRICNIISVDKCEIWTSPFISSVSGFITLHTPARAKGFSLTKLLTVDHRKKISVTSSYSFK
ncbi:hypothetical protein [Rickettsia australis]|uniref:Uncharacterized protein n=1 Tax=Rickettsia australis (strain Cutlack) TaxID=1105110 RepID=H8K6Z6_RICAC|nr:hypothetical protein [Rickettsia australis]AFC71039.1 hypothetical protein MC5_03515 [Rickettsia australis str. Cutlack]